MSLKYECQRFLEQWLVAEDAPSEWSEHEQQPDRTLEEHSSPRQAREVAESALSVGELGDHLQECVDCRDLLQALKRDQRLLTSYFGAVQVPAPPRIELREALNAASGHPRRTSLTLMPFLLGVILLLLALLAYLLAMHQSQNRKAGRNSIDTDSSDSRASKRDYR